MLINKTEQIVKVVYNGKTRDLNPGEGIDIRDFDIANKDVSGAEKHIMSKHPGKFEQKPNVGRDPVSDKQTSDKIKKLEDTIASLTKELADVRASEKLMLDKFQAGVGEVAAMEQRLASQKKEVDKYKSEAKDLEDEAEKLRGQAATPHRKGK